MTAWQLLREDDLPGSARRTKETDNDSDDGRLRWDVNRDLTRNSDNQNQEHLNFKFQLYSSSEEKSTSSDDVAAAGQCDVIARRSSRKKDREKGGGATRTDDVSSLQEQQRQAKQRSARKVTVPDAEISSLISGLETEIILRNLDDAGSASRGEEATQISRCKFMSKPQCLEQASRGCQGYCGEHYATLVRSGERKPSDKLLKKVRKLAEKERVAKMEKNGYVEPPRNRERSVRPKNPGRPHRSPRRKSEPSRVTRPKSKAPRKDYIIESSEELNYAQPQPPKGRDRCIAPQCNQLLSRHDLEGLCRSCQKTLKSEKQKSKDERKRIQERRGTQLEAGHHHNHQHQHHQQPQQQHHPQPQQHHHPQPQQHHQCGCHTPLYTPSPMPPPHHCSCLNCTPQYMPPCARYRPQPCHSSRCVQADDAEEEEPLSPAPESPPSSLLVGCQSYEYQTLLDSGFDTFGSFTEKEAKRTAVAIEMPEDSHKGLCEDFEQLETRLD